MREGKMSEVLENKVSWSQRGVCCEEGRQGDGRTGSREEETDAIGGVRWGSGRGAHSPRPQEKGLAHSGMALENGHMRPPLKCEVHGDMSC